MIHHKHYLGVTGGAVPSPPLPLSHGEMYWDALPNTTATSITAGTPSKVLGTTTLGEARNFDMPLDNRLRYTGGPTRVFRLQASVTGDNPGGSAINYVTHFFKNGVAVTSSANERRINASQIGSQICSCMVELATNDYIEFFCNANNNSDFIARYANIVALELRA